MGGFPKSGDPATLCRLQTPAAPSTCLRVRDEADHGDDTLTPESDAALSDGAVVYTPPAARAATRHVVIDDEGAQPEPDYYTAAPKGPVLGPAAPSPKTIGLVVGGVLAIAAANVWLLDRARTPAEPDAVETPADGEAQTGLPPWLKPDLATMTGAVLPPEETADAHGETSDLEGFAPEGDDKPAAAKDKAKRAATGKQPATVLEAVSSGCSTSSVDGLSRQIIQEGRCIDPDAFAPVPSRKNLTTGAQVFLYLEAPARDRLLKVLDAHPTKTMVVNSALRTIAQQFLLSKWGANKRCGVELAATPGESNHESGLALDIREPGTWRPLLEAEGFKWFGPTDKVHFDYRGPGAVDHSGKDVLAFQRLWNRNHPDDPINLTSRFDADTEARMKKSPPGGFATGAQCKGGGGSKPPVAVKPADKPSTSKGGAGAPPDKKKKPSRK